MFLLEQESSEADLQTPQLLRGPALCFGRVLPSRTELPVGHSNERARQSCLNSPTQRAFGFIFTPYRSAVFS